MAVKGPAHSIQFMNKGYRWLPGGAETFTAGKNYIGTTASACWDRYERSAAISLGNAGGQPLTGYSETNKRKIVEKMPDGTRYARKNNVDTRVSREVCAN